MLKFPVPVNVHNVRQFMKLVSYFRKFVRGFTEIVKVLTDLTKQKLGRGIGETQSKRLLRN